MTINEEMRRNAKMLKDSLTAEYKAACEELGKAHYPSMEYIRARERALAMEYSVIMFDTFLLQFVEPQEE